MFHPSHSASLLLVTLLVVIVWTALVIRRLGYRPGRRYRPTLGFRLGNLAGLVMLIWSTLKNRTV
ncbi:hypothetical protein DYU11_11680 [Fibrisoma montanum]|uniref:Uncharacterized protein n=1 Tax=Fibrisoma montanum TaxID=2305895 RepID=A0A418MB85_9BACT|nr:hypothetical protein [Fibrisoma montanum]RIV23635.1 hypothetical protein DYU11_11680 [Fibrisoma montanum]